MSFNFIIQSTGGDIFQPLEDQRLSTTDDVSFNSISGDGTNLTGYAAGLQVLGAFNVEHSTGTISGDTLAGLYDGTGTPTFDAANLTGSAGALEVGFATQASYAANDADTFFGGGGSGVWGTPTFDASNLTGFAGGLTVSYATNADQAARVQNITGNAAFVIDGVSYYPHVTGGVLTFTDTP
jgi:hypothetical protein